MLTHWSCVFLALTHHYAGMVLRSTGTVLVVCTSGMPLWYGRLCMYDILQSLFTKQLMVDTPLLAPLRGRAWWRHQMETFSPLLAICAGNSPVPGEFPTQRPVTGNFDVFFDLRPNKRLSKQSWGWWFETPSRPLWRHRNGVWGVFYEQSLTEFLTSTLLCCVKYVIVPQHIKSLIYTRCSIFCFLNTLRPE